VPCSGCWCYETFLGAFEEREKLMEFYELCVRYECTSYFRPGGVHLDLPKKLLTGIFVLTKQFNLRLIEI
jgi:NADH-quinone oxidoreductase subunit D